MVSVEDEIDRMLRCMRCGKDFIVRYDAMTHGGIEGDKYQHAQTLFNHSCKANYMIEQYELQIS
jgi:hypothetical protein